MKALDKDTLIANILDIVEPFKLSLAQEEVEQLAENSIKFFRRFAKIFQISLDDSALLGAIVEILWVQKFSFSNNTDIGFGLAELVGATNTGHKVGLKTETQKLRMNYHHEVSKSWRSDLNNLNEIEVLTNYLFWSHFLSAPKVKED